MYSSTDNHYFESLRSTRIVIVNGFQVINHMKYSIHTGTVTCAMEYNGMTRYVSHADVCIERESLKDSECSVRLVDMNIVK